MRTLVLVGLFLFCVGATGAAASEKHAVIQQLHHFSYAVSGEPEGTVRVIKTALQRPEFLFPAYVPVGEVYRAAILPANGRLELDFAFWDGGRYEVRVEIPGQAPQVQEVKVYPPAAHYARMAGLALVLVAMGVLAGYVSYTMPRPGAAAAAALILMSVASPRPGGVQAHGAAAAAPRASETANLSLAVPPGLYDVELHFRHAEDDLDLIRSTFRARSPVTFAYRFPEGAPYEARLTATPVGGGPPVVISEVVEVEPVHPGTWELWRGWLVGVLFFLCGGAAGLWLGSRRQKREVVAA